MGKTDFFHPESKRVWQHLETAALRSHHDPCRAFEDFLGMTICVLSGGQMEEEYLALVKQYANGEKGRRAIDAFPEAVGDLIVAMERTRKDILGDIYQGAISYGHNGQFFTPGRFATPWRECRWSVERKESSTPYVLKHITDLLWRIHLCGLADSFCGISAFR